MDKYSAERDQNQNLVLLKNDGKVCQIAIMSDVSEDALAAQVPAEGWVYDFCRTVSHAELQSIMAAAQAGAQPEAE